MGRPGLTVAAAFAASSISMVVALSRTSVAIVLVIFALSPLAAAVLAWIIIGERVRSYTWIAIGVTVVGVGFMVSGPGAGWLHDRGAHRFDHPVGVRLRHRDDPPSLRDRDGARHAAR